MGRAGFQSRILGANGFAGIRKGPPCMSPAVGVGHAFQFPLYDMVLLKDVRYQHSVIVFAVLQRKLVTTPVLALVQCMIWPVIPGSDYEAVRR